MAHELDPALSALDVLSRYIQHHGYIPNANELVGYSCDNLDLPTLTDLEADAIIKTYKDSLNKVRKHDIKRSDIQQLRGKLHRWWSNSISNRKRKRNQNAPPNRKRHRHRHRNTAATATNKAAHTQRHHASRKKTNKTDPTHAKQTASEDTLDALTAHESRIRFNSNHERIKIIRRTAKPSSSGEPQAQSQSTKHEHSNIGKHDYDANYNYKQHKYKHHRLPHDADIAQKRKLRQQIERQHKAQQRRLIARKPTTTDTLDDDENINMMYDIDEDDSEEPVVGNVYPDEDDYDDYDDDKYDQYEFVGDLYDNYNNRGHLNDLDQVDNVLNMQHPQISSTKSTKSKSDQSQGSKRRAKYNKVKLSTMSTEPSNQRSDAAVFCNVKMYMFVLLCFVMFMLLSTAYIGAIYSNTENNMVWRQYTVQEFNAICSDQYDTFLQTNSYDPGKTFEAMIIINLLHVSFLWMITTLLALYMYYYRHLKDKDLDEWCPPVCFCCRCCNGCCVYFAPISIYALLWLVNIIFTHQVLHDTNLIVKYCARPSDLYQVIAVEQYPFCLYHLVVLYFQIIALPAIVLVILLHIIRK